MTSIIANLTTQEPEIVSDLSASNDSNSNSIGWIFYHTFVALLLVTTLLHVILEYNYFLRSFFAWTIAKYLKKNSAILEETTVKGRCLSTDVDTLLGHMNNARYLRELDFARIDFFERTGLYKCIRKHKGSIYVGASTIRYRRLIPLFQSYMITSKIVHWNASGIFMEHRFINPKDSFIHTIIFTKMAVVNCDVKKIMQELIKAEPQNRDEKNVVNDIEMGTTPIPDVIIEPPKPPAELELWIQSNLCSSDRLLGKIPNAVYPTENEINNLSR